MSARAAARVLAALATGLCQDADVRIQVEEGRAWAWQPARRTILVGAADLQDRGPLYCAGVLAHEVGHVFVSRYVEFRLDHLPLSAAAHLLNAIEDPRANTWSRRRYPGTGAWLDAAAAEPEEVSTKLPDFVMFALECCREEPRGWARAPAFKTLPMAVQEALDETRDARREYAELLPPADLRLPPDLRALEARYRSRVVPRLREVPPNDVPAPREQYVQLIALEALELAEARILPRAFALLEADTKRLANHVKAAQDGLQQARAALDDGSSEAAGELIEAARAADEGAEQPEEGWLRVAGALLELVMNAEQGRRKRLEGLETLVAGPGPFHPSLCEADPELRMEPEPMPADAGLDGYARALALVRPQADELVRRMEDLFVPRRRTKLRAGHASGARVDLRRLMRFEADPRRVDFWLRATKPDRRDVTVSLLVDLSGSMAGAKAVAALQGSVLLVEVLSRLGIPFTVNGFQDELITLCGFEEPLCERAREALGEMPFECEGRRPGGHNLYGHNDDGPCLLEAAGQLAEQPQCDKLLIVISDGEPAGSRSTAEDLVAAVQQISREQPDTTLVGIGLGPDTEHVRRYYPHAVACVAPCDLAREVADLVERALLGASELAEERDLDA